MKSVLTEKERYEIISDWATKGPTSYYNLVIQTEFYITKHYMKNNNISVMSKLKNSIRNIFYEQKL